MKLLHALCVASAATMASAACPVAGVTSTFSGACTMANIAASLDCDLSTLALTAIDVKRACDASAYDFGEVTNKGQQFDKTYMDGGGAFNHDAEEDIELEFSAERVFRFRANAASNARLLWPEYRSLVPYVGSIYPPYMDNFNLTGSCELRAAMCCFMDDRINDIVEEKESIPCRHEIGDSRQSSNLNKGWSVYDSSSRAYCTAFTWGQEGSTSEQYKGNSLFDLSFGTLLTRGSVENIDGAPMCGCVEKMPVVSHTSCRELTVDNEQYSITLLSNGTLDIIQDNAEIGYKDCEEGTFLDHYASSASTQELAKMKTRIVGDCAPSNVAYLNDRFLIAGNDSQFTYPNPVIWEQVAGSGLSYYPVTNYSLDTRDVEFRTLFAASPNKIVYRHCESCAKQHQHIYYRRKTAVPARSILNFLDLFLNNWFSKNNLLGTDFDLYASYQDAVSQKNKWLYCNYDDPKVGFPRDCGPTVAAPCQWNSFTKSVCSGDYSGSSVGFYVEKPPVK